MSDAQSHVTLSGMSDINKIKPQSVDRPDANLAGVAGNAFQAYNAMETTKRRHYQLLEVLDNKKKNYNLGPTESERAMLDGLLKDHDEQVKRFTALSSELKQIDAAAHQALFIYIGAIGNLDQQPSTTH